MAVFGDVMVSVEVAELPEERLGLLGFSWTPKPVAETEADSETGPEKPLRLDSVIVELADPLWNVVNDGGLVEMLKSGVAFALTDSIAEWVSVPLVAVTVTV
jgi:hypothetical protein